MKINWRLVAAIALIAGLLAASGCSTSVPSRGWAGVTQVGNTLVFTSMSGKIYSFDATAGTQTAVPPVSFTVTTSGGILGCSSSQTPIAVYTTPGVSDQDIIIGGFDGRIYDYTVVDGKLKDAWKWIYPQQGTVGSSVMGGVTIANGKVYFSTINGVVYALNASDGTKLWSQDLKAKIWSNPTVSGDTLYIGTFNRHLHALNISDGSQKWDLQTDGAISEAAIVSGGTVYVGSYGRSFYAVDASSGKMKWQFPAAGAAQSPRNWFWAKPLEINGVIYAPNLDGNLYALDETSGNLIKAYNLGDSIASSPVAIGNSIVAATTSILNNTSNIYVIDTASQTAKTLTLNQGGSVLPQLLESVDAPLFASNGLVYIHTQLHQNTGCSASPSDNFYSVNPQTGDLHQFSLKLK